MQIIQNDIRNRRILSPAESINAITIGAIHTDMSSIKGIDTRINILPNQMMPSPITTHGFGYKNP